MASGFDHAEPTRVEGFPAYEDSRRLASFTSFPVAL